MSGLSPEDRATIRALQPFKRGRSHLVEIAPRLLDALDVAEAELVKLRLIRAAAKKALGAPIMTVAYQELFTLLHADD